MFIESPAKQFSSLLHYSAYMLWNADLKKVRKYLIFVFLTTFMLDLIRLTHGREVPIPFPLASFTATGIFLIFYLLVNSILRVKHWDHSIRIAESTIIYLTPKQEVRIEDINSAKKIGDRILVIGIGQLDRTIDLVFPDNNTLERAHRIG